MTFPILSGGRGLHAAQRHWISELPHQAMSIADQLIQKGRALGKEEGLVVGHKRGLVGGEIRLAQRLLGLPMSTGKELAAASMEELQELAKELVARAVERYSFPQKASACSGSSI